MPNTLHVDYELKTHEEAEKIIVDAMEIARHWTRRETASQDAVC